MPTDRLGPDIVVSFRSPPGEKSSYFSWISGGPPEVVIEVLSPNNGEAEMSRKFGRYLDLGVEEYYVYQPGYDPPRGNHDALRLDVTRRSTHGFLRTAGGVQLLEDLIGFTSPRMGLTFAWGADGYLDLLGPGGRILPTYDEARREAEEASARADEARHEADEARHEADEARARAERLEALLRARGIDPETIG